MLMLVSTALLLHVVLDPLSLVAGLPMPVIVNEVRALWKPYLNVVFRTEVDAIVPCGPVLRLRVTDQESAAAGREAQPPSLGWIEFVEPGQPAAAITVSVRTVRNMLREGRWMGRPLGVMPPGMVNLFLARALGRAVAHEIGHYVLRSTSHQQTGLMRKRFTIADIMDGNRTHFRLERQDEILLASRLAGPEWVPAAPAATAEETRSARADETRLVLPVPQICHAAS